jgi:hypothetical protein
MTFVIEAYVAYQVGCVGLKIHNDFMKKWHIIKANRAAFLKEHGLE